jgi:hypothetical protein
VLGVAVDDGNVAVADDEQHAKLCVWKDDVVGDDVEQLPQVPPQELAVVFAAADAAVHGGAMIDGGVESIVEALIQNWCCWRWHQLRSHWWHHSHWCSRGLSDWLHCEEL